MDGSQMDMRECSVCEWASLQKAPTNFTRSLVHVQQALVLYQIIFPPDPFTPDAFFSLDTFYNKQFLSPDTLFTKEFLHSTTFTQNSFYTRNLLQQRLTTKQLYTKNLLTFQKPLHHTPFPPEASYPTQLLRKTAHQRPFRPKTFLHQKILQRNRLLHQTTFAPNRFHTRRFLHGRLPQTTLTLHILQHFYTKQLLHQITQTSFYTRRLLHQTSLARKISDTHQLLHQTSLGQCLAHHCAVWSFHVLLG